MPRCLRSTVASLLPDADVYVTDWHNARDIPVSAGKFDVEDYTLYLAEFMKELGPETNVIAVCQPVPLTLAATAYLAAEHPEAQPRSLVLIGGPVDPDAAATEVTDFGRRVTMGQLEHLAIQRVGFKYKGAGRLVYPGLLQLQSFITMNAERHGKAFAEQIFRVSRGEASDHDAHNRFYDEYLAVMDMTAEFYLSTVERVFKNREIATNSFVVAGRKVDFSAITKVAVMTVEGRMTTSRPRAMRRGAEPSDRVVGRQEGPASGAGRRPLRHLCREKLAAEHPSAGAELHRQGGGQAEGEDRACAVRPVKASAACRPGRSAGPLSPPRAVPAAAGGRPRQ
jgi:hypothetical protein